MSTSTTEYLKTFIPVVNFLSEILGKNSEIVLHDLTNLDSSILAIRNNYLTKRKVGDPATDYVLRMVKEGIDDTSDYSINYRGISNRDNKKLKSASLYIRKDKKLIGMICVNTDETIFDELTQTFDRLLHSYKQNEETSELTQETFSNSIEEMAENAVMEMSIAKGGISANSFKQDDKYEVIKQLHDSGFFLLKGSVPEIAKILHISEPTVYRYLQNIKGKSI